MSLEPEMMMCCDGVPEELKKDSYRGGSDTGSASFALGNQFRRFEEATCTSKNIRQAMY